MRPFPRSFAPDRLIYNARNDVRLYIDVYVMDTFAGALFAILARFGFSQAPNFGRRNNSWLWIKRWHPSELGANR